MQSPEYKLIPGHILPGEPGPVIKIQESGVDGGMGPGAMFWCPCMTRRIVVRTPPHESITFDKQDRLTIRASLGAYPTSEYPDKNWCHAMMTDGKFELLGDSVCLGTKL